VLHCVAICCRSLIDTPVHLRYVCLSVVCCSVLQWCCSSYVHTPLHLRYVCISVMCCSVLQCVAVCCSVSQCVAVCRSVSQCVAVCRSVSQYVAVCCSVCNSYVGTRMHMQYAGLLPCLFVFVLLPLSPYALLCVSLSVCVCFSQRMSTVISLLFLVCVSLRVFCTAFVFVWLSVRQTERPT